MMNATDIHGVDPSTLIFFLTFISVLFGTILCFLLWLLLVEFFTKSEYVRVSIVWMGMNLGLVTYLALLTTGAIYQSTWVEDGMWRVYSLIASFWLVLLWMYASTYVFIVGTHYLTIRQLKVTSSIVHSTVVRENDDDVL